MCNIGPYLRKRMKTLLSALLILIFFGCGSKKKTVDVNKSVYKENKDLSVFRQNDVLSSIFLNKLDTQIVFEPINPAIPIKINDSTSITNARVVINVKKTDSTAINRDSSTVKVKDKGEVYSSNETRNVNLEREDTSNNIKWSIWGVAVIFICVMVILFWGKLKTYYQNWKKRSIQ